MDDELKGQQVTYEIGADRHGRAMAINIEPRDTLPEDKPRLTGVITRVNLDRETGFIERQTGPDLLFRAESLIGLPWGQSLLDMRVSFEVGKNKSNGGEVACNIEKAE
jgi:cold shock CspA family protein